MDSVDCCDYRLPKLVLLLLWFTSARLQRGGDLVRSIFELPHALRGEGRSYLTMLTAAVRLRSSTCAAKDSSESSIVTSALAASLRRNALCLQRLLPQSWMQLVVPSVPCRYHSSFERAAPRLPLLCTLPSAPNLPSPLSSPRERKCVLPVCCSSAVRCLLNRGRLPHEKSTALHKLSYRSLALSTYRLRATVRCCTSWA